MQLDSFGIHNVHQSMQASLLRHSPVDGDAGTVDKLGPDHPNTGGQALIVEIFGIAKIPAYSVEGMGPPRGCTERRNVDVGFEGMPVVPENPHATFPCNRRGYNCWVAYACQS